MDAAEGAGEPVARAAGQVEEVSLQRFLGEHDVGHGGGRQAGQSQAVGDGPVGESPVMFQARMAFFLGGGDELSVHDERGIGIVPEGATDAEHDG